MGTSKNNRFDLKRVAWAVAAAAVAAAVFVLFCLRRAATGADDAPPAKPLSRPSEVYTPKAEPLLHAEKPVLPVATGKRLATGGDEAEDVQPLGGDDSEDDDVVLSAPVPDNDPELLAMSAEKDFSAKVWGKLQTEDPAEVLRQGAALLASSVPEDRAMGGVLLFMSDALDDNTLDAILADGDISVPLTLLDWIRDFGTEDGAAAVAERLLSQGVSRDDLHAYAKESRGTFGGGRSALDLWLRDYAEDGSDGQALAALVTSDGASYDVRAQGLFKLLEPETKQLGDEALAAISDGATGGESILLEQFADKVSRLAEIADEGDDCKIWDSQSPVVYFLTQDESAMPARDLANYLEYALRRDDQEVMPNIEEGTWEFANDYFETTRAAAEAITSDDVDALDRIACALDRLVDYDPAFNPFETVEDDGDEPEDEDVGDEREFEDGIEDDEDEIDGEDDGDYLDEDDEDPEAEPDEEDGESVDEDDPDEEESDEAGDSGDEESDDGLDEEDSGQENLE